MIISRENFPRKQTKRIVLLTLWFVIYLNVGGLIFSYLEQTDEKECLLDPSWKSIHQLILTNGNGSNIDEKWSEAKLSVLSTCSSNSTNLEESLEVAKRKRNPSLAVSIAKQCAANGIKRGKAESRNWSFVDAVFFCMTVVSTIGYGHMYPSTSHGQMFCVIYAMLGIPTSGLLLGSISDLLAELMLVFFCGKWRKKLGNGRCSLVVFTLLYLSMGMILLVFVPAIVFSKIEQWKYSESVYFAFITISTIGFGDLTAATKGSDPLWTLYKIGVMVWMLLGLGYWILVLNFLQKVIKSHQLADTLVRTGRLLMQEANDLKQSLSETSFKSNEANFVPERTKGAVSLLTSLSGVMLAMGESEEEDNCDSNNPRSSHSSNVPVVPGIHAMGQTVNSSRLFAALLTAIPLKSDPDTQPQNGNDTEKVHSLLEKNSP